MATMTIRAFHNDAVLKCPACQRRFWIDEQVTLDRYERWVCQMCGEREAENLLRETMPPAPLPYRGITRASRPAWPTERGDVIKLLKRFLRERSGKDWSVSGSRGTAYGWITIRAPKSRSIDAWGSLTNTDRQELGALLGMDRPVHHQGQSIAAGRDYYRYYLDQAAGIPSEENPQQYWD